MAKYGEAQAGLESRIAYEFKEKSIFVTALTHPSFGDGKRNIANYQRLEFIGDRILNLYTAETLYREYELGEGEMARKLNSLVRKECCAEIAREIGLGEALYMSAAEDRNGGRDKKSILGDACEAILAAVYLDGGDKAARRFYKNFWAPHVSMSMMKSQKDPKTSLQELSVLRGMGVPTYEVISRDGPDHAPSFLVQARLENGLKAQGRGSNKKQGEREAAKDLIRQIMDISNE